MISSNYNVLQISSNAKDKYQIGQIFEVPNHHLKNWRFSKFHGLEIKDISYGFGIFLHFDYNQWKNNNPPQERTPIDDSFSKFFTI